MQSDVGSSAARFGQPRGCTPPEVDDRAADAAHTGRALATLTMSQRQVLVLSYFDQLTQAQIAARLRVPQAMVRVAAASGLRRLAAAIEADR